MKAYFTRYPVLLLTACILSLSVAAKEKVVMPVSYSTITELPYAEADSVLKYGDHDSQFIEVWRPSEPSQGNLVFIHGGCWLSDYDIKHARPFMSALSRAICRPHLKLVSLASTVSTECCTRGGTIAPRTSRNMPP